MSKELFIPYKQEQFEVRCLKCGSTNVGMSDGVEVVDDYDYDENLSLSYEFNGVRLHCNDCGNDTREEYDDYEEEINNDYKAHTDIYCP